MKLSGKHNSLVFAGLLLSSAAGGVQAQDARDARTDLSEAMAAAAAEGAMDEALPQVEILHLEPPIALSRLQEEDAVDAGYRQLRTGPGRT